MAVVHGCGLLLRIELDWHATKTTIAMRSVAWAMVENMQSSIYESIVGLAHVCSGLIEPTQTGMFKQWGYVCISMM